VPSLIFKEEKGDRKVNEKLTKEEFVLRAIKALRKPPYKGIHTVYSGFNNAFKEYFGEEAREAVDALVKGGKIQTRFVRGGVMLYLPGEIPPRVDSLKQILGGA